MAAVISGALSFILSPIGLVTAAVAGLGAYILFATNAGGQALAWLGERFDELKSFALDAFQGIKDALAAGDISLAAKILWLSLQVAWRAGIASLQGWWLEFKGWFLKKTADIFYGAVAMIANAWFNLRKIWLTTVNYWTDILLKFAAFYMRTWNDLNGWVAKQWTKVLGKIDPSIDVTAVNKRIDQDTKQQNINVSGQTLNVRLEHERELADLEKNRTDYMISVAGAADRENNARRTEAAAEMKGSEAELAQARKEFDDAVAEAAKKRATLTAKTTGAEIPKTEAPPVTTDRIEQLQDNLNLVAPAVDTASAKFDIVGTFSAAAISGLGLGSSTAERTAKAAEETAQNTRRIVQKLDTGEASFD
jgi:lysophospholipase L1-like esterase